MPEEVANSGGLFYVIGKAVPCHKKRSGRGRHAAEGNFAAEAALFLIAAGPARGCIQKMTRCGSCDMITENKTSL